MSFNSRINFTSPKVVEFVSKRVPLPHFFNCLARAILSRSCLHLNGDYLSSEQSWNCRIENWPSGEEKENDGETSVPRRFLPLKTEGISSFHRALFFSFSLVCYQVRVPPQCDTSMPQCSHSVPEPPTLERAARNPTVHNLFDCYVLLTCLLMSYDSSGSQSVQLHCLHHHQRVLNLWQLYYQ